ncbi:hypothetical protein WMO40_17005 [Bacillaceae bacterium CLA-AA-H227]|uniref:Uncharacterized protein n=1 Tax=Robertmurraya yapensis (ex Hitch et al 2024) TaxID=3133160 RepID=A0ACC6SE71_9BACI
MNLLNISLVILIMVGLLFLVNGLREKSQLSMFFGGMAFLAPILYFIGWTPILPFVAPIALLFSYLGKKNVRTT